MYFYPVPKTSTKVFLKKQKNNAIFFLRLGRYEAENSIAGSFFLKTDWNLICNFKRSHKNILFG